MADYDLYDGYVIGDPTKLNKYDTKKHITLDEHLKRKGSSLGEWALSLPQTAYNYFFSKHVYVQVLNHKTREGSVGFIRRVVGVKVDTIDVCNLYQKDWRFIYGDKREEKRKEVIDRINNLKDPKIELKMVLGWEDRTNTMTVTEKNDILFLDGYSGGTIFLDTKIQAIPIPKMYDYVGKLIEVNDKVLYTCNYNRKLITGRITKIENKNPKSPKVKGGLQPIVTIVPISGLGTEQEFVQREISDSLVVIDDKIDQRFMMKFLKDN